MDMVIADVMIFYYDCIHTRAKAKKTQGETP
jgi:hypothetical protein